MRQAVTLIDGHKWWSGTQRQWQKLILPDKTPPFQGYGLCRIPAKKTGTAYFVSHATAITIPRTVVLLLLEMCYVWDGVGHPAIHHVQTLLPTCTYFVPQEYLPTVRKAIKLYREAGAPRIAVPLSRKSRRTAQLPALANHYLEIIAHSPLRHASWQIGKYGVRVQT